MYEGAGFDIAVGINMAIASSSRNASVHIFAIVPEVHGKNRFGLAEFSYLTVHIFSLFRSNQPIGHSIHADRHICKQPQEEATLFNQEIDELFAGDDLRVLSCIAA